MTSKQRHPGLICCGNAAAAANTHRMTDQNGTNQTGNHANDKGGGRPAKRVP